MATVEGASIPSKWEWHYRTLLRLREGLMQERGERRSALRTSTDNSTRDFADLAETASERAELLAELAMEEHEIVEIEAALGRIRKGTYGRCEATGRPIPAARLRAVPWARLAEPTVRRGSASPPRAMPRT